MRKIIHVDLDCFYAAVEEKYNPSLRGKPLGVGGPADSRSVLCTANYEARKFGVRAAIPSSRAVRLCPDLILIPPHFDLYKAESKKVRAILNDYSDQIEPLSLDEAYLDVTNSKLCSGSATLIGHEIKSRVKHELDLSISVGVAPNKFLAKVASDWRKPNGLFTIAPRQVDDFVKQLPVEKIFGVGKVTATQLHRLGIKTCGDLQLMPLAKLQQQLGSRAIDLKELSFGRDLRPVETQWERKSVSVEETFAIDIKTLAFAQKKIPELFTDWQERMMKGDYFSRLKGIQVKLKYSNFEQTTLEQSFVGKPTLDNFSELLEKAWARRQSSIRLLGIGGKLKCSQNSTPSTKSLNNDHLQLSLLPLQAFL